MPGDYTQLVMRRTLDSLPDLAVPEGFLLRGYQEGDEAAWNAIVGGMCGDGFDKAIKGHRFFRPERVMFVCRVGGKPAATATAWGDQHGDESLGMVHMVATDPKYRGKGLGFCAVDAVLHQMKAEGLAASYLTTDDFRIPAIKVYLKLGFVPDETQEGHARRWQELFRQIRGEGGAKC